MEENINKEIGELKDLLSTLGQVSEQFKGIEPLNIKEIVNSFSFDEPQTSSEPIQKDNVQNSCILGYKNLSKNPDLKLTNDGRFQIQSNLPDGTILIPSMKTGEVSTGLYFEIENGYEIQLRRNCGDLFILNVPVNSSKKDELKLLVFNIGKNDIQIKDGDIICDAVVCPIVGSGKLTLLKNN
jgi:dUTP pyrophosphatase